LVVSEAAFTGVKADAVLPKQIAAKAIMASAFFMVLTVLVFMISCI
jgi:hypothetical protein